VVAEPAFSPPTLLTAGLIDHRTSADVLPEKKSSFSGRSGCDVDLGSMDGEMLPPSRGFSRRTSEVSQSDLASLAEASLAMRCRKSREGASSVGTVSRQSSEASRMSGTRKGKRPSGSHRCVEAAQSVRGLSCNPSEAPSLHEEELENSSIFARSSHIGDAGQDYFGGTPAGSCITAGSSRVERRRSHRKRTGSSNHMLPGTDFSEAGGDMSVRSTDSRRATRAPRGGGASVRSARSVASLRTLESSGLPVLPMVSEQMVKEASIWAKSLDGLGPIPKVIGERALEASHVVAQWALEASAVLGKHALAKGQDASVFLGDQAHQFAMYSWPLLVDAADGTRHLAVEASAAAAAAAHEAVSTSTERFGKCLVWPREETSSSWESSEEGEDTDWDNESSEGGDQVSDLPCFPPGLTASSGPLQSPICSPMLAARGHFRAYSLGNDLLVPQRLQQHSAVVPVSSLQPQIGRSITFDHGVVRSQLMLGRTASFGRGEDHQPVISRSATWAHTESASPGVACAGSSSSSSSFTPAPPAAAIALAYTLSPHHSAAAASSRLRW
jgi:hypothetical protein